MDSALCLRYACTMWKSHDNIHLEMCVFFVCCFTTWMTTTQTIREHTGVSLSLSLSLSLFYSLSFTLSVGMCVGMRTYVWCERMCMYATYVRLCIYTCIYACIYACICVCVCMYVWYACMLACMNFMRVCTRLHVSNVCMFWIFVFRIAKKEILKAQKCYLSRRARIQVGGMAQVQSINNVYQTKEICPFVQFWYVYVCNAYPDKQMKNVTGRKNIKQTNQYARRNIKEIRITQRVYVWSLHGTLSFDSTSSPGRVYAACQSRT